MAHIILSGGQVAVVDDADFQNLSRFSWFMSDGRAFRRGMDRTMIQMSVHLMNPTPGLRVDHIDGNKLNCRRANLRTCTHAENIRNRKKHKNGSSRFKGVHNDGVRWRARIKLNGKAKSLGTYRTEIEAALAYDRAAREMFGEFARPNFP